MLEMVSCSALCRGVAAGGVGAEVSRGTEGLAVAMGVSGVVADQRASATGCTRARVGAVAASSNAGEFAAGDEAGVRTGPGEQAGDATHLETFIRHAFVGGRNGYPHRAGFAGSPSCGDDAALHACDAEAGAGGAESAGWVRFFPTQVRAVNPRTVAADVRR